jgi:hypothetical protein
MTGMLVLNRIRYPSYFSAGSTVLVILTACVGVGGAVYFVHRLATRT